MHQPICSCEDPLCPATGGGFYVSARKDQRYVLLLGPFQTHDEARAKVDLGSALANRVDARAPWYAYGTARMTESPLRPGMLNDLAAQEAAIRDEAPIKARTRRRARRA